MTSKPLAGLWTVAFLAIAFSPRPMSKAQSPVEWQTSAWHLWRIDVDGSNCRPVDNTPDTRCGSPVWSPDGLWIAYDVLAPGTSGYQIAVIHPDGTDRRLVCSGSIPSWSNDSAQIACQGDGLQVVNIDGTGRESHPVHAHSSRWSPRDNVILSASGNGLRIFDLAQGTQSVVFPGMFSISHGFGVSPDGNRIGLGTHNSGLWIAAFDDRTRQISSRQVVGSGTVYHTSWAPDGKRIVFAWRRAPGERTQLYTVDVDAGEEPILLPGIDTSHQNVNPAWSPDGKTIVFSVPAPLEAP